MTGFRMMVLGGGSSQLNALNRLRREGYRIILADQNPEAEGRSRAHEFEEVSTFDIPGVVEAAGRRRVQGIMTLGTDQPVLSAAEAAREHGLPCFHTPETARAVTNKRIMKRIFRDHGIPTAPWLLVSAETPESALKKLQPPLVLKPVDSQGQRGVFRIRSHREVFRYLPECLSYSREKSALLEEYYPGTEITVSGWVHETPRGGGPATEIFSITDRVTMEAERHIGICAAHRFPSIWTPLLGRAIEELTLRLVAAFAIKAGPLYFQMLIGQAGIRVNEIACRLGGAYEDEFIPLIAGRDILGMLIAGCRGLTPPAPERKPRGPLPHLAVPLLFCRPGEIAETTPESELLALPGVRRLRYLLPRGTRIEERRNSTQRSGYLIIQGPSREELNRRLRRAFRGLGIYDDNGQNILDNTLGYCLHPEPKESL